jgi:hypothetical protein
MALTPAQRQQRRRQGLPRRIDYYPSLEALAAIGAMQAKELAGNGGYRSVSATFSAIINQMVLNK